MTTPFENNHIVMLSFASTRSTWVSTASVASKCGISYDLAYRYLERQDGLDLYAPYYRFEYVVKHRHGSYFLWAISRGYV